MDTNTDKPLEIYVVSDSLGDLASSIALAAASQFGGGSCVVHRLSMATRFSRIADYINAVLKNSKAPIIVFHTIANQEIRSEFEKYLIDKPVVAIDLIGQAIEAIAKVTGMKAKGEPGLFRQTSERYYTRIEAMGFAVEHDDGLNVEGLKDADIVIIGVSRTSKTPLSIYLASTGYNVANIPLALEISPPAQLFEIDSRRIFGLTSNVDVLSDVRYHRLGNATGVASSYAAPVNVQEDLDAARRLMRRLGCIVINTAGRSIEETAREILQYYAMSFASPDER